MADTNVIKSQYLDEAGLRVFYGIIKDQWTSADEAQYDKVKKEYADADEVLKKALWGQDSAPEVATLAAAGTAIKKNATDISELTSLLAAEVTNRENADTALDEKIDAVILTEQEARAAADEALGERIDALTAGGVSPDWLSDNWLPVSVDGDSIKVVEGDPITIKLPDGTDSTEFTPQLLTSNLVLGLNNNKIVLKSATNDTKTYGEVDLSAIVMDRVLTAGTVIYDENDADPEEGYVMTEGLVYPYIAFTISAYDKETATETKEYVRISVKDLVDEYTASGEVEIVRETVNGEQPVKTIKLTQAFLDRIAAIEQSVADEKTRAEGVEASLQQADSKLAEDLEAEVTRSTAAEAALSARIEEIAANPAIEAIPDDVINSICGVVVEG